MKSRELAGAYYSLLIANLLSNCLIFHTHHWAVFVFFTLAATFLLTYAEYLLGQLIPGKMRSVYYTTLYVLYVLLIAIEVFVIVEFKYNITEDLMYNILDTNPGEAKGFFSAYTTPGTVVIFLLSLVALYLLIHAGGSLLAKCGGKRLFIVATGLAAVGIGCYLYIGYSFVVLDDGFRATQYTTLTRILGGAAKVKSRVNTIDQLRIACTGVKATDLNPADSSNIVVVIGESFSRYHSSLYGYRLRTNPKLEKRRDEDGMLVFSDVISRADQTHEALRSFFSTDSLGLGFGYYPLIPVIFRSAGYTTYLWDNQYLVNSGISFMSDRKLSELLYDKRNQQYFGTDGPFLETLPDVTGLRKTFFIIHLAGQHFYYNDHYEPSFKTFTPEDYDAALTEIQRTVLSDYDNATLYNDAMMERILERFDSTETLLFYFTDHGEELYENGDFSGHTNALRSKDLRYQICSPFLVWMSLSYKKTHPEICRKLEQARDVPMMTDDVSHLLMDIAQIQTETYSPYRSAINPAYNRERDRMILNAYNYDQWLRDNGFSPTVQGR